MEFEKMTREQLIDEIKGLRNQLSSFRENEVLLSEKVEKYRTISDYASDWEYWLSPDGTFFYTSPSCERITGYPLSRFRDNSNFLRTILHPEDNAIYSHHIAECPKCAESSRLPLEFRIVTQSGEIVWLEHKCQPIHSKDGIYLGRRACNRDITDRKNAELALIASEKQLRGILEASTESVFLMDKDGQILMANTTTAERLNTTIEALIGTNIYKLIPPDVAENRKKKVQKIIETRKPMRFEDERFGRIFLNSVYPIQREGGEVTHLAVFGLDITEERLSKQIIEENRRKLAEVNNMLQLVIDTIPVRIFWKNLDSLYLGCNRIFAKDAGKNDPTELIGENDYNLGWKAQADLYVQDDQAVIKSGIARIHYEEPQNTPTGDLKWLRTSKAPLHNQDGDIVGILGTYEDITERKTMEEGIRESEQRYRSIFQNNHAILLIIDPENGRIVDANPAACRYYGYALKTILTKNISDINTLHPEQVREEMTHADAELGNHFFFSHKLANGEIKPVEVFSGPIKIKGKKLLYSIIHDISERKQAEEEREKLILELKAALLEINTLSGLLPICSSCKKIRDDQGYWQQIESYIRAHSQVEFTHSVCPECAERLYPEVMKRIRDRKQ